LPGVPEVADRRTRGCGPILSVLFDIKWLLVQIRDLLKDDDEEEEAEIEPDS
jgi:hypothetical protein